MYGPDAGSGCVIGNNGRRSRPDTIIWLNLVFITPGHGNMPTQDRAIGESPTALYLLLPLPTKGLRILDT